MEIKTVVNSLKENLSESEIYIRAKTILVENGWTLLGGEPPDGTDNLPRIELKNPHYSGKGSKGSKKVDLIAIKSDRILLLELKRFYSESDIKKLNEIFSDEEWRIALDTALESKKVFQRVGVKDVPCFGNNKDLIIRAVGLSKEHIIPNDFLLIIVQKDKYRVRVGDLCKIDKEFFNS